MRARAGGAGPRVRHSGSNDRQHRKIGLGGSAPIDPDIAARWSRIGAEFHANQRVIAQSLADKGALAPGLDVESAADILWTINNPNLLAAARRKHDRRTSRASRDNAHSAALTPAR